MCKRYDKCVIESEFFNQSGQQSERERMSEFQ